MIRTPLLFCATLLTPPLCAQRVLPFGSGTSFGVDDMAVWNGRFAVRGSCSMGLPGVDGSAVQSWDGAQVFSFPSFFTTGPGARYVQELNGLLYVGGRSISCDNMARWDGGA
ncbi:MAG: hypothetical protein JNJ64_07465 [Flavobacteriales bacterium]|nr:hypothetical protein [Flavobacteriales bacterium]